MSFAFQPSEIVDEIYEMLEEYIVSSSEYEVKAINKIEEFLDKKYPEVEYTTEVTGDSTYGSYAISWIEHDHPVLILINYMGE